MGFIEGIGEVASDVFTKGQALFGQYTQYELQKAQIQETAEIEAVRTKQILYFGVLALGAAFAIKMMQNIRG